MMIGGQVRRLGVDDWPVARALRLAAFRDVPHVFGSTPEREEGLDEGSWRDRLGGGAWFAAGSAARPAGLACGITHRDPAARELVGLWVAPDRRGTGLGDALVGAVCEWARSDGAQRVVLWVVGANAPAHDLYARHGFRPTGRAQPLPREPSVLEVEMQLVLSDRRPAP